jgi:hypothetical protein
MTNYIRHLQLHIGFGKSITWTDNNEIPPGHKMSFKESLHILSTDIFVKLIVPSWAMGLTPHTRRVRTAFDEVEVCDILRRDAFIFC